MECSSSCLEDKGEVEYEYNDNDLTDKDYPEIELDDKEDNDVVYEVMNGDDKTNNDVALKATQTPLLGYVLDDQNGCLICTQVGVPVDPTMKLSKLVFEHNFEKAFNVALQSNDISIVSWLCSTVDLRWVLSLAPLPLSQGVLLNLLWQLACDIKKNSPQTLAWMTVMANSMVPTDPGIAMHGKPILVQVYAILNHQCTLPTITNVEIVGFCAQSRF
ncbi:Enhancer of mRNA-decapping protein 4 [Morella rubra]|uniref:Enhancer of mRNA-decapping protein 4 n=1 Tax=Morella rubra TaxID=262757 RepID=A0A6A1W472_9ROSI|nr:Enhancer of mRNA-decapping protein 4 [Morella rubra]